MFYFSTSCHKESDDCSECSQDDYTMTVLKGHFQPQNNKLKVYNFRVRTWASFSEFIWVALMLTLSEYQRI